MGIKTAYDGYSAYSYLEAEKDYHKGKDSYYL